MYIEKTKKGYKFSQKYKGKDGKYHTKSITLSKNNTNIRNEAQKILDQKIDEAINTPKRLRLSRLVDLYCSRSDATERSLNNYYSTFKGIIELLGDPNISDLTTPYLINCLEQVISRPSMYNRYVLLLKMVLKWAYKRDFISTNPAEKLDTVKNKSTKSISDKYMEQEELTLLLDKLSICFPYDYYICKFMALTGMRVGEVMALKMDDISEDYIRVDETYDKSRHAFDDPKGDIRDVYIQPELKIFMKEVMIVRKERMLELGLRDIDLVFFDKKGNPFSYTSLNNKLKAIAKETINKNISSHAFRHTHISILAAEGIPLEIISRRVGHENSNITKKIYLHVTSRMRERENTLLNDLKIG